MQHNLEQVLPRKKKIVAAKKMKKQVGGIVSADRGKTTIVMMCMSASICHRSWFSFGHDSPNKVIFLKRCVRWNSAIRRLPLSSNGLSTCLTDGSKFGSTDCWWPIVPHKFLFRRKSTWQKCHRTDFSAALFTSIATSGRNVYGAVRNVFWRSGWWFTAHGPPAYGQAHRTWRLRRY